MKPVTHTVISGGIAVIFSFFIKSKIAILVCFLSGILIDIDHLLDYYLAHKRLNFRMNELVKSFMEETPQKLTVIFHSYELFAALWLSIFLLPVNEFWLGLAVGATGHFLCDIIANPVKPVAYSLAYRYLQNFESKKILTKMRGQKIMNTGIMILGSLLLLSNGQHYAYAQQSTPFAKGEKITYAIKKMGLKAGTATLEYKGLTKINNHDAHLIVFTASALRFLDCEELYLNPADFYPMVVKRTLNLWGKKELIIEEYSRDQGIVRIVKYAGGEQTEEYIENQNRLDNIYGFLYRYRKAGKFIIGDRLEMNLPTQKVNMELVKKETLRFDKQSIDTYYLEGSPKKIRMWIGDGPQRIPYRIEGALSLGSTAMILTDYESEN